MPGQASYNVHRRRVVLLTFCQPGIKLSQIQTNDPDADGHAAFSTKWQIVGDEGRQRMRARVCTSPQNLPRCPVSRLRLVLHQRGLVVV